MYAKLKPNGQIQVAPKVLRIVVSNPSDERLEYEGYHKVIETDPPEYNQETQYIQSTYVNDGEYIRQMWEVIDLTVAETISEMETVEERQSAERGDSDQSLERILAGQ